MKRPRTRERTSIIVVMSIVVVVMIIAGIAYLFLFVLRGA